MDIKIEKGKKPKQRNAHSIVYPFGDLRVGESFEVSFDSDEKLLSIRSSAHNYGRRNDKKFTVRKEGDSLARVYRIKND